MPFLMPSAPDQDDPASVAPRPEGLARDPTRVLLEQAAAPAQPSSLLSPDFARLLACPQAPSTVAMHHFGDYELIEELGRGGMGIVFRAHDTRCCRQVALKIIPGGPGSSTEARRRFRLEAETTSPLSHVGIVPILEVDELVGFPFLTMPVVEGGTLHQHAAEFREPQRAAGLVAKLARAVHYAHQQGVLHRDLKPGNILLDRAREPHLTDFGLAKWIHRQSDLTQSIAVLGTPDFMAPEQASGRSRDASVATDVYGLGAILYFLLVGSPPHRAKSVPELLRRIADDEPAFPGEEASSGFSLRSILRRTRSGVGPHLAPLPSPLVAICRKCIEKNPHRRYRSAEDLAADLERWQRNKPVMARTAGPGERLLLWSRRQPVVAGLTTAMVLLFTMGFAGTFFQWRRAVRSERAMRVQLSEAQLHLARVTRLSGRPGQRFDTIALAQRASEAARDPRWRDEVIAALALPDVRPWKRLDRPTTHPLSLIVDADIERFAELLPSGDYQVRALADGRQLFTLRLPLNSAATPPLKAEFSSDGRRFFATYDDLNRLLVWDLPVDDATPGASISPSVVRDHLTRTAVEYARWSPTGDELVTLLDPKRVGVFKGQDGSLVREVPLPPGAKDLRLSPTGHLMAILADRDCSLVDVGDGSIYGNFTFNGPIDGVAFTPDEEALIGDAIAPGQRLGTLHRWEFRGLDEHRFSTMHKAQIVNRVMDPKGRFLVTSGWDSLTVLWEPIRLEPRLSVESAGNDVRISRDGRRMTFFTWDHRIQQVWQIEPADEFRRIGRISPGIRQIWPTEGGWCCRYSDGIEYLTSSPVDPPLARRQLLAPKYLPRHGLLLDPAGVFVPGLGWAVTTNGGIIIQSVSRDLATAQWRVGSITMRRLAKPVGTGLIAAAPSGTMVVTRANEIIRLDSDPPRIVPLPGPIEDVVPSGSGGMCARRTGRGGLEIWDAVDGRLVTSLPDLAIQPRVGMAWSPDDRWFVFRNPRGWQVLDTRTWQVHTCLSKESDPLDLPSSGVAKFSRDGKLAAVALSRLLVVLYQTGSWTELACLPASRGPTDLAFSDDSSELAIASELEGITICRLTAIREELGKVGIRLDLGREPGPTKPYGTNHQDHPNLVTRAR